MLIPEQLVCKAKEKLLEAKCAFVLLQRWIVKHSNQRLVLCVFPNGQCNQNVCVIHLLHKTVKKTLCMLTISHIIYSQSQLGEQTELIKLFSKLNFLYNSSQIIIVR